MYIHMYLCVVCIRFDSVYGLTTSCLVISADMAQVHCVCHRKVQMNHSGSAYMYIGLLGIRSPLLSMPSLDTSLIRALLIFHTHLCLAGTIGSVIVSNFSGSFVHDILINSFQVALVIDSFHFARMLCTPSYLYSACVYCIWGYSVGKSVYVIVIGISPHFLGCDGHTNVSIPPHHRVPHYTTHI